MELNLPWAVTTIHGSAKQDPCHQIRDSKERLVACFLCPDLRPYNQANAAHIVKCVNAHEKLVEALENIKHSMQQALIPGNDKRREIEISLSLSVYALKLARGE